MELFTTTSKLYGQWLLGRSENFKNANFNYGYSGFSALLYLETEKT